MVVEIVWVAVRQVCLRWVLGVGEGKRAFVLVRQTGKWAPRVLRMTAGVGQVVEPET